MSESDAVHTHEPAVRPCGFDWCTTPHGATLHPDDEDHRSAGWTALLTLRRAVPPSALAQVEVARVEVAQVEIEAGLLRRIADVETWVRVEDGSEINAEITVASARELIRAFAADPAVARELGLSPLSG